jgi:hypothetical protein
LRRLVWYPANAFFRTLDVVYRQLFRLRPVGALLYIQPSTYRGPERQLGETLLRPGDPVGIIHFNNQALEQAQAARSSRHGGFVFARLLIQALQALADRVQHDPEMRKVAGFYGISWIPPHGGKVGFVAEPLPDNWRTRCRAAYFRMLLFAFSPTTAAAVGSSLRAHEWWMSRDQLLQNFGGGKAPR